MIIAGYSWPLLNTPNSPHADLYIVGKSHELASNSHKNILVYDKLFILKEP